MISEQVWRIRGARQDKDRQERRGWSWRVQSTEVQDNGLYLSWPSEDCIDHLGRGDRWMTTCVKLASWHEQHRAAKELDWRFKTGSRGV